MRRQGPQPDNKCRYIEQLTMAQKKSFIIRVDPDKLAAIEKWASDEFRSTNGQIEWILDQALRKAGRLKDKNNKKTDEPDENGSTND